MNKQTVLILFGGYSTEHFASCESAANVLRHIDRERFDVLTLGITLAGDWILTDAGVEEIEGGTAWLDRPGNKKAIINPIRNSASILILEDGKCSEQHIDCVFPALHGFGGEDGSIQGLLELANIPYVGCNICASAVALDKDVSKIYADILGIKRTRSVTLREYEFKKNRDEILGKINFNYPIFVKPANGGSSVGVIKVTDAAMLSDAIEKCFTYENKIIVEEGVAGKEISVVLIGNEELRFGDLCEIIIPENEEFDFASKYVTCTSSKRVPAAISEKAAEECRAIAGRIYKTMGCSNISRIDFFVTDEGEVYFNEVNTLPALRNHGIVSMVYESQGLSFKDVITEVIEYAFKKCKRVYEVNEKEIRIH